jgi:very-short-patch-repair endonuclease
VTRITARDLRKNPTIAEQKLWSYLRQKQIGKHRFRRQVPVDHYIVDFLCFEKRLIIEVDGGQHAEQEERDNERTSWLERQGFHVLRFWNNEVLGNIEGVVGEIAKALANPPHLIPPPQGGRMA